MTSNVSSIDSMMTSSKFPNGGFHSTTIFITPDKNVTLRGIEGSKKQVNDVAGFLDCWQAYLQVEYILLAVAPKSATLRAVTFTETLHPGIKPSMLKLYIDFLASCSKKALSWLSSQAQLTRYPNIASPPCGFNQLIQSFLVSSSIAHLQIVWGGPGAATIIILIKFYFCISNFTFSWWN